MSITKLTKKIINVETGQEIEREFSAEEYEQQKIDEEKNVVNKEQEQAKLLLS
jgi:hypothetical protein